MRLNNIKNHNLIKEIFNARKLKTHNSNIYNISGICLVSIFLFGFLLFSSGLITGFFSLPTFLIRPAFSCTAEEFFALMADLKSKEKSQEENKIIIYTDSALAQAVKSISDHYQKLNPDCSIIIEPSPAKIAVRKIIDLGKTPDLLIFYSNYLARAENLIPSVTGCLIQFARDKLVIAYTDSSQGGPDITVKNWPDYLFSDNIKFGIVKKEMDPLGIYTESMALLAESLFNKSRPGFFDKWQKSFSQSEVRANPIDLVRQAETGNIDYAIIYSSLARAHRLKTLDLQEELNFSKTTLSWVTAKIGTVKIKGPAQETSIPGELIWAIACPLNEGPHPRATSKFLSYLASGAMGHIEKAGLMPNIVEGMAE
jgi:ABC-type molybdate transport system substrate-binding protein